MTECKANITILLSWEIFKVRGKIKGHLKKLHERLLYPNCFNISMHKARHFKEDLSTLNYYIYTAADFNTGARVCDHCKLSRNNIDLKCCSKPKGQIIVFVDLMLPLW